MAEEQQDWSWWYSPEFVRQAADRIQRLLQYLLSFLPSQDTAKCDECGRPKYACHSDVCANNIWIGSMRESGEKMCMLPGCVAKPENSDYCGGLHKDQHMKQLFSIYQSTVVRRCEVPGCHKLCIVDGAGYIHDFCSQHDGKLDSMKSTGQKEDPILFYDRDKKYFEFTNFYSRAPILLDNKRWETTEHYFQAQKFAGTPYKDQIRLRATPREAFQFSRSPEYSNWRRSDWENVKVDIMYKALLAKFTQHEDLRRLLLSTGHRSLVEHTCNDSFWGDGGNGYDRIGTNHLGKLLMKIRSIMHEEIHKLRAVSQTDNIIIP